MVIQNIRNPYGRKIGKQTAAILDLCDSPVDTWQCLNDLVPSKLKDLMSEQLVTKDGLLTQHGKILYSAHALKLKPAACLLLMDLYLQHRCLIDHNSDCCVDVSVLKQNLSLFSSRNRTMLPSELTCAGFIHKSGSRYYLCHDNLEKISGLKYLDDLISHLHGKESIEINVDDAAC
jgi:hypothetical protein